MSYNRALHLSLRVFMKAYPALRRLLFTLPAELSHDLSLNTLALAERTKVLSAVSPIRSSKQSKQLQDESVELLGLHFPNRVGLAAGLDKNGDYFPALSSFGFGFIEIGTVTPIPQGGNPNQECIGLSITKPLSIAWVLITKVLIIYVIEFVEAYLNSLSTAEPVSITGMKCKHL